MTDNQHRKIWFYLAIVGIIVSFLTILFSLYRIEEKIMSISKKVNENHDALEDGLVLEIVK